MSLFTSEPPANSNGKSLAICRTPQHKPMIAICTSDQVMGCPTHYWHGRTIPHFESSCTPCLEGMPWRWHGWVGAYSPKNHQHVLFEMTAQASEAFKDYRLANGTLRGAKFTSTRPSGRVNGRLLIVLAACNLNGISLPEEPHTMRVLSILWNIPLIDLESCGSQKSLPKLRILNQDERSLQEANGQGLNERHVAR